MAARTRRRARTRPAPESMSALEELPNVGPSLAADLRFAGIEHPRDLVGQDPYSLYDALCSATGARHDACVLDVFISAVRFMEGAPARPWWRYTAERKRTLRARAGVAKPSYRARSGSASGRMTN